jgi:MFS family permease
MKGDPVAADQPDRHGQHSGPSSVVQVNVALPTIRADLHMAAAQLQWVVTGYALTFGSLLLAGGRLADLLGRRRLLVIGLIIFAVASLACGLARWPVMLIAARPVQGGAGALVSPAALSLLSFLISTGIVVLAALLVAVQLRPGGRPEDANVHEPARHATPVPVLAECQLRKC